MKLGNKIKRSARSGLTLLEVLLVIAILGYIASLVVPRYLNAGTNAQTQTRATQVANINSVLDSFQSLGGTFGAAYAAGNATTNGTLRNDTVAHLLTDLAAGVYAGGQQFSIPSATVVWNGTTPTDAYYAANQRLQ